MVRFTYIGDDGNPAMNIIDDDTDPVVLRKADAGYYYCITGAAVNQFHILEDMYHDITHNEWMPKEEYYSDIRTLEFELQSVKEELELVKRQRDELVTAIAHTRAMKQYISNLGK